MFKKYLFYLLLLIVIYLFQLSPPDGLTHWQQIKAKGYMTWITRPSPLTYYSSLDGIVGLEYAILKDFCKTHAIDLNVVTSASNDELFKMFSHSAFDIAGANFTLTEQRKENFLTSVAYDETFTSLVSSLAVPKIRSIDAIENYTGAVINNSSYVEIAKNLSIQNIKYNDKQTLYGLLQQVINRKIDYTLADANIVAIYKSYMPQLRIGIQLSDMNELVFLLKNDKDTSLKDRLDTYINHYKSTHKVNDYKLYIKKTLPNSRPADTVNFLSNYEKRWPSVKTLIYATAKKFGVSPILLGAISYQESHWNPAAVSPTLVKGLMMLTKAVAIEQEVNDRNNPLQSLEGGTKYFLKMKSKVPDRIVEPHKTNFALAAYNIGYSHLENARKMTQKAGKNPDVWGDVREFLIAFNSMKNIKADGKTAVRYVENIHVYQNLLQWKEQQ